MSGIQVYLIPNILKGQMILRTIYHKLGNYFLLVKMLFKNIWMEFVIGENCYFGFMCKYYQIIM